MTSESERRLRARGIGDQIVAYLREHEEEHHDGERCEDETINLMAYFCHRTGMHLNPRAPESSLRAFKLLVARAGDYDAIHHEHIVEGPS